MDEGYSSAAMVALVTASLRRRGLPVSDGARCEGPRVTLSAKRRLLAAVAAAYGESALILAGQAVAGGPFDPLGHALTSAPTPVECLARWGRLERYVHSRHRTIITSESSHGVRVRHSAPAGSPPVRHESLLVAGVLAGLLSAQGCVNVRLSLADGTALLDHGHLITGHVPPGPVDRFRLAWIPGTAHPPGEPPHPAPPPEAGRGPVTGAALRRVLADTTRRWTVGELATAGGMSARTLQRRLHEEGSSFSSVVAAARVIRASMLLGNADVPLSTVGFLAGYADGPHFAREFARRTGASPGRYRTVITPTETDHEPSL
ncbi:AraC family transcriptional regulator [Nonomuraea sp. NPDC049504]|uniref:helix-turn-helix transcriptional regulator n=1 Tax=Nonomuraea sp. NPDC049504 TaxID=3154729 RepID=UPI0034289C64